MSVWRQQALLWCYGHIHIYIQGFVSVGGEETKAAVDDPKHVALKGK